jgi:DNA-binding NarL/FixJ family response regulator
MNIILADHHHEPRWALKTLLEERAICDRVIEADNSDEALSLSEKYNPKMVLLDSDLPGGTLQDLITKFHALKSLPIVIVMSSKLDHRGNAIDAGADDYISKVEPSDTLLETLGKHINHINIKEERNQKNLNNKYSQTLSV